MATVRATAEKGGWTEKLNLGSREGLEDFEVLCALSHDPEFVWMSPGRVADRSGVAAESVTASLDRLTSAGLVTPHPSRPGLYGEISSVRPWLQGAATQGRAAAA
jgi:hypothetical protein